MRIQHNIMAMNAYRNYTNNVSAMKSNLEKLSSGYKINRAGDDAAGLAISEKMRAQITGLETAQKNAKDGISLVQTAEGALTEVHDMLNRMVELATQSANGTYDNTTDRAQMQKEVNQLLDEINRIADSSNFNGIKLLDGTLGLNTSAFDVAGTASGTAAVLPQDITADALTFASVGDGALAYHGSESTEQVLPSFEINLGGLELEVGTTATTTNKGKVTLTIGTTTATIDASVVVDDKADWDTAAEVAAKIVAKYGAASAGATATKALKIGDLYFKAAAVGSTGVKFTCIGNASDGAGNVATAATLTDAHISDINGKLKGMAVSVGGSKVTVKNDFADHNIMNAEFAVKESAGKRAGIDVTLTYGAASTNGLRDGYTLSIGTNTFKFAIKAGASGTDANTIYIDTDKIGTTASKIQNEAIRQLAKGVTGDFVLTAKNGTNGVLHIEEKAGLTDPNKYKTAEDLKNVITLKDAGTPAVNEGTKLDITSANIKEGNVLTIGSKQVKFAASDKNATAATLKAKLETALGNKYTVEIAAGTDASGVATGATRFIIRSTDANDTAAPTVLGKGLTLQIGDTSDTFNQLNVSVQDMHAASLGIGNLDISTEEAAQAAVDKIKNAINTVSDVRGTLGATQNRLDHTINNLSVMTENIQDAESTIRDTDVAEEMMAYTKNNILIQSAQAMLAQANQVPQGVLQLLG